MIKRILALTLGICIFCTSAVFAELMSQAEVEEKYLSDLIAPERLLKYDYSGAAEEDVGEELEYSDAITVVTALGLMEYMDDGTFDEKAAVKMSDFAKLFVRLSMGETTVFDEGYDRYSDTEFITQNKVVHYLVIALGYDAYVYEPQGESPYLSLAQRIGILRKINFTGAKNITRGELAQMLYNSLTIDMVEQKVFSEENNKYEKVSGKTIIGERFNAVIVEGVVTAQNGINIYSELVTKQGTMEIDRAPYRIGEINVEDMLGKRVIAVVTDDEYDLHEILGISVAESDKTITVDFDDVTFLDGKVMKYMVGEEENILSISDVNHIVHNGKPYFSANLSYSHLIGDGELRICATGEKDTYSTAIVYSYTTACVSAVASFSEKLFIQGASRINGKEYVTLDGKKTVVTTLNGEKISPYELSYDTVVSIMENTNQTVVYIKASDKTISGTITELDDEYVYVEGKPYRVSDGNEADAWSDFIVGQSGTFYLDYSGRILRFVQGGSTYTYGYLIKPGRSGAAIDPQIRLRMFTVNNKFEIFDLAEEITLDGQKDVAAETVYDKLTLKEEELCYQPVRYKLNSEGQINFLDTVEETTYDSGDKDAIRLSLKYSGVLNWTASSKHTSLDDSTYNWNASTPNFVIPTDRSMEEEYLYRDGPSYVYNQRVDMGLYCADEYDTAGLLVEDKAVRSAAVFRDGYRYACVTRLKQVLDDNGDTALALEVLDGSNPPNFPRSTYVVHRDITDKARELVRGDIVQMSITSSVLKDFKLIAEEEWFFDEPHDVWIEPQGGRTEVLGTIESVDVGKGMVKVSGLVDGNETYAIYTKQSLGLYDKKNDRSYDIALGDLEVGDRVFCFGGVSYMRILAVRE